MSRRSKEALSVQLFPFLAVLVCTMGALIFLLLVTTRQVRQRAIAYAKYQQTQRRLEAARAEAEAAPLPVLSIPTPQPPAPEPVSDPIPIPQPIVRRPKAPKPDRSEYEAALSEREQEIQALKSKWKSKAGQLEKDRQKLVALLVRKQTSVDESQEQTESLQQAVNALESQVKELARTVDAGTNTPEDEAELLTLEKQISEMKKKLRAAQMKDLSKEQAHFQVVPFDPQSGTTRRPILLECTESGVRFLPEGITITPADLAGFTTKMNPIAAGTGALINYWNGKRSQQGKLGDDSEPYVLILVRPNGVVAYYVAMKMLEPIRTSHGYELIEESTVLHLPDVDKGAKSACDAAIQRLMAERDNIFNAAMRSGAGASVFGANAYQPGSSSGGGGGGQSSSGGGRGGTSRGGGGGVPGGFGGGGVEQAVGSSGNTFSISDITGGDHPVGTRSWERIENFQGRPRGKRGGESTMQPEGVEGGPGTGQPALAGGEMGVGGGEGENLAGGGGRGARPGRPSTNNFGEQLAPFDEDQEGEDTAGELAGRRTGKARGGSAASGSADSSGESGEMGDGSSDGPGDGQEGGGEPQRGKSLLGKYHKTPKNNVDTPGNLDGMMQRDRNMPIGRRPGQKGNASSGTTEEGPDSGSAEDPDGDGGPSPTKGKGDTSGGPISDNDSSRFRNPKGPRIGLSSDKRPKKSDEKPDQKFEPEMLKGRHWGYSEAGASIGFEREVRVDVLTDKLIMAEKYEIPIGGIESRQETFEQFVTALDKCSREWGRPPQGFFWTPRLKFVVKPESYTRYELINDLMTRSGISTSHEFANAAGPAVEFGREMPSPKPLPPATPPVKKNRRFSTGGAR